MYSFFFISLLRLLVCGGKQLEQGFLLTKKSGRFTVILFSFLFVSFFDGEGKSNWMMVLTFYSTLHKGGLRSYILK